MRTFIMRRDSKLEPRAKAGTLVYECTKHDYGVANEDTRASGKEHISVTLDPSGDWPSFTVPIEDLDEASLVANTRSNFTTSRRIQARLEIEERELGRLVEPLEAGGARDLLFETRLYLKRAIALLKELHS